MILRDTSLTRWSRDLRERTRMMVRKGPVPRDVFMIISDNTGPVNNNINNINNNNSFINHLLRKRVC